MKTHRVDASPSEQSGSSYEAEVETWRAARRVGRDLPTDPPPHPYYRKRLKRLTSFIVEEGRRVLCLGFNAGAYLDWVRPSRGVAVESNETLAAAGRARYAQYEFFSGESDSLEFDESFDYILLIGSVEEFFDIQKTFDRLRQACDSRTRIVVIFHSFLWQPLVDLAQTLRMTPRRPTQNWLSLSDLTNMLGLSAFEVVRVYRSIACPIYVPFVADVLNAVVPRIPGLDRLCFVQALVARPTPAPAREASVSIIVPCRNEAGNIEPIVRRTPEIGTRTELIFCDDKSTDGTGAEVRRMQAEFPARDIKLIAGPGICKAENVWTGFDAASGEILMILDADMAVPPEELQKFYRALTEGKGEFINGSRMVYPMRAQAMRLLNIFGNKALSILFTWVLGQPIKDTLCGTKVLWRDDYARLKRFRGTWGLADRWGDYELIFGAARAGLKIVELPVHYMDRTYGQTKMTGRFGNARIMFQMGFYAYVKFRP